MSPAKQGNIEVICLTYGEPETHSFWEQFDYSLSILKRLTTLVAPIPRFLLPVIAAKRAWDRKKDQKARGFHSPLEPISRRFVSDLESDLQNEWPQKRFRVHLALEFRQPQFLKILKALDLSTTEAVWVVPLYVADGTFTSGISKIDFESFVGRNPSWKNKVKWLSCPNGDPEFARLTCRHILSWCEENGLTRDDMASAHLVMGAHGTLVEPPAGIDNGLETTLALRDAIVSQLSPYFGSIQLGWLNHTRGGTWTEPEMSRLGETIQKAGPKKVIYYPVGFIADNAESLVEGPDALGLFKDLIQIPCLNQNPTLVDYFTLKLGEVLDLSSKSETQLSTDQDSLDPILSGEKE